MEIPQQLSLFDLGQESAEQEKARQRRAKLREIRRDFEHTRKLARARDEVLARALITGEELGDALSLVRALFDRMAMVEERLDDLEDWLDGEVRHARDAINAECTSGERTRNHHANDGLDLIRNAQRLARDILPGGTA